jgi:uncharacterized protein YjbJ (UPF0337 family)
MSTTEVKGSWNEQKIRLKKKFAALTDNDLLSVKGSKEEMIAKLQVILGKTKAELEKIFETL